MKDIKIRDVSLVSEVTGNEKIPVSNGSGKPAAVTINLILEKVPEPDLSLYATKEEIPIKVSLLTNDSKYLIDDGVEDGIYGLNYDDEIYKENPDEDCFGVILIKDGFKLKIDGRPGIWGRGNESFRWDDVDRLADRSGVNYSTIDSINEVMYLPKSDGTYTSEPHVSPDFTTWTEGALSDFNGHINSEDLLNLHLGSSTYTNSIGSYLNAVYEFTPDRYIPSLGQLAFIYLHKDSFTEYLEPFGGKNFEGVYWSSTEKSQTEAWTINFDTGEIKSCSKTSGNKVRSVGDLNISLPLKTRINTLETKVSELENKDIPEATIETVGGVKKFEIMDLQDKSNIDNLYKAYNTLVEQMINAGVAEDTRFVDLGLPSGTLWATCNIGSDSIEDPGLFFLWGDIEGYYSRNGKVLDKYGNEVTKQFNNSNYKWIDSEGNIIKYFVDLSDMNNPILDTRLHEEDNVILLTNPNWAYPLWELMDELVEYTRRYDVDINGAKLLCLESINNGNKLYFPYVTPLGNNYGSNYPMFLYNYASTMPGSDQTSVYTFTAGEPFKPNGTQAYSFMRSSALPIRYVKNPQK